MERIDKVISEQLAGISRKDARAMIRAGEVAINGRTASDPAQKTDPGLDEITVAGKRLFYREHLYIMLNKPAGVVCATRDRLSETVLGLLPEELRREGLFPAGRLDRDTVGFVLITDDGELAHRILSPRSHVPKRYFVRLSDDIPPGAAERFRAGIEIDGGEMCFPAEMEQTSERECFLTLHEGKYHQVKRMFAALGNSVEYLKRTEIAGIRLDERLSEGECRELAPDELERLMNA